MKPIVTVANDCRSWKWCKCQYCKGPKRDRVVANRAARAKLKLRLKKAYVQGEFE